MDNNPNSEDTYYVVEELAHNCFGSDGERLWMDYIVIGDYEREQLSGKTIEEVRQRLKDETNKMKRDFIDEKCFNENRKNEFRIIKKTVICKLEENFTINY